MWGLVVAMISGALMSIQGVFNTEVTKQAGVWVTAAWVQLSAFAVCLIASFFTEGSVSSLFQATPKYMLTGGVIGAFITYTVIVSMDRLGPARAALLIVVAQLLVAYLIEVFGLFGTESTGFEPRRVIGMGIAIAGIVIFKW